jgi:hypothetical protein
MGISQHIAMRRPRGTLDTHGGTSMELHKGKTVKFKQDTPDVVHANRVDQAGFLGKITLKDGKKPYIFKPEQNAEFSSEQLADISEGMNKLEATRKAAQSH